MRKSVKTLWRSALTSFVVLGVIPATAWAGDLSRYRNFQFGADLATVAKQADTSPSQVKIIHRRPALIQELAWRPQPIGASAQTDPAKEVVFSFYSGELFQIAISYDRYQTEGMTTADFIEAISSAYGMASKSTAAIKDVKRSYSDPDEVLAQWQDPDYRFELIRSEFGPSFRLVGVSKRLEAPVQAAIREATRLDVQEAPQRDAERAAQEEETVRVKQDKARLENKPKFRP
jgi:hypothetical protein